MADPFEFDDPGPLPIAPPSRARRAFFAAVVVLLIVSMVFLAWVSGRGEITVTPGATPTPFPALPVAGILAL